VSLRNGWLPTLLISAAIVALSWPYSLAAPIGIDESWRAALHIIGPSGLHFGEDIAFTYGPLGSLSVPSPFFGMSSVLAIVATGAVYLAAAATLLVLAGRLLPIWAAAAVVLVTARAVFPSLPPFEMLQALIFVWCVEALLADRLRVRPDTLIVGAALVAAIALMGKTNVGLFASAMLLVTSITLSRPWWRGALIFAAAAIVAALAIWIVAGQPLGALPAFITGSIEIARGYSEAMVVDTHVSLRWVYVAYIIAIAILGWIGWQVTRDRPRAARIALLALGAILAFAEWKTAFTRNYTFYAMATAIVALFPLASRLGTLPTCREIAALAFAPLFVALLATASIEPVDLVNVRASLRGSALTAAAVLPWRQAEAVERTRAQLREELAIPDDLLAQLRGQSVHIDPWQTIVAFAYPEIRWSPLPVFQAYTAYTTELDELNADRLRSDQAPAVILRERVDGVDGEPLAVDHRFVWFESPAATLETSCRYVAVAASDRWEVLDRTQFTCGDPEPLGTVIAKAGEVVAVPKETRPDRFVIVRISGFPDGIVDKLRAAVFRADEWYIDVGDRGHFRLVPGTANDGLLLAVPVDTAAGPRFAFGAPISSLEVSAGRSGEGSDSTLTFEFFSVPQQTAGR
jgi:hypothetical protein